MALPVIAGLAPVAGGILGRIFSSGDREAAAAEQQRALEEILRLNPELQSVVFDRLKSVGQLTPQLEQLFTQGNSELANINVNPQYKQAAMQALQSMRGIANEGGMTIQDQSNLNKILSQTSAQEAGKRGAIMQDFAARGKGGSGFELAQQLLSQQESANRANEAQTDVAAMAQQRALEALRNAGSLGQSLDSNEFNQKARAAEAQDLINRFNTQNRQDVTGRNTDRSNDAQRYNLTNDQRIADSNVNLSNQERLQNNQYAQQHYQNQANRAGMVADARNNRANQYNQSAQDTAGMWGSIGQGVGNIASAYNADQKWQGYVDAIRHRPAKRQQNNDDDGWFY